MAQRGLPGMEAKKFIGAELFLERNAAHPKY